MDFRPFSVRNRGRFICVVRIRIRRPLKFQNVLRHGFTLWRDNSSTSTSHNWRFSHTVFICLERNRRTNTLRWRGLTFVRVQPKHSSQTHLNTLPFFAITPIHQVHSSILISSNFMSRSQG